QTHNLKACLTAYHNSRLPLRHIHPYAPPVRRTGNSGTVPQAAGAGLVFLPRTWSSLAVSWFRECAYPPTLLPSDPDRLAPVPNSRSVVLSEEFSWCGPRLTPPCLFDLDLGSGRVGRPHRNGRACRARGD